MSVDYSSLQRFVFFFKNYTGNESLLFNLPDVYIYLS